MPMQNQPSYFDLAYAQLEMVFHKHYAKQGVDLKRGVNFWSATQMDQAITSTTRRPKNDHARKRWDRLKTQSNSSTNHPSSVCVGISVFDTPLIWLQEAIDSVRAQDFQDWELLIRPDGPKAITIQCQEWLNNQLNKQQSPKKMESEVSMMSGK